jgi:hypothetical protein
MVIISTRLQLSTNSRNIESSRILESLGIEPATSVRSGTSDMVGECGVIRAEVRNPRILGKITELIAGDSPVVR